MKVEILEVHGVTSAMYGLGLSHGLTSAIYTVDFFEHTEELNHGLFAIADRLAHKGGGHNKFLESIKVWMVIQAPRYWWQEFDTYRLVTKQSESTMHTLTKCPLTAEDFEGGDVPKQTLWELNDLVTLWKDTADPVIKRHYKLLLKRRLPEGFLQKRQVCLAYSDLQRMTTQREKHELPEWHIFIKELESLPNRHWIFK